VVVNSAGNDGFDATHNTLGARGRPPRADRGGASTRRRARVVQLGRAPRRRPHQTGRVRAGSRGAGRRLDLAHGLSAGERHVVLVPADAGVAALLVQIHPTRTAAEIRDAMRASGSQAAAPDNLLGYGIVDAVRAANALSGR
jgi:subtilisin family serine protease